MGRLLITDKSGRFSVEVSVSGPALTAALGRDDAEEVLRCAFIAALAVLAQEDRWPEALLHSLWDFMAAMRETLREEVLM